MTATDGTDIAAKEAELAAKMEELAARKAAVEKRVRELMAAEDHKAGVSHAQAIFAAKQEKLAGRYPVVAAMKDYVEDLSKRTPASGHRAKQFAVAVRTGHGAETVRVEIQLMTTVQHAWDQRNHPIYEWSREGDKLPDHLVIRDVALAETLYLVDQQAAHNWQDILEWRKGKH